MPAVNVGVAQHARTTRRVAAKAVRSLPGGRKVFAGQRPDAFYVDLGSIFDLGALRPLNSAHLISMPNMNGVNGLQAFNVHSIAIQVPDRRPDPRRLGCRPAPSCQEVGDRRLGHREPPQVAGLRLEDRQVRRPRTWKQVARLGNPLVNEVVIPMAEKDQWNARPPSRDAKFAKYVNKPELARLLPVLYPGAFPNLAAYRKPRADLNAILLTGIPTGVVPGFQNYTGPVEADMLRLNVAIPPTGSPNNLGLVAGDAAGFPNGRRVTDDVVTIEMRAIAGLTIPLVDPSFTPDGAASAVADGTTNTNAPTLGRSRTWRCPAAATRPCRARPRRREPPRPTRTRTPGRARCCSTSAGTSGPWWSRCPRRWSARRWRSSPPDGRDRRIPAPPPPPRARPRRHGHRPHVAVVDRPVAGGEVPSLVYPELVGEPTT